MYELWQGYHKQLEGICLVDRPYPSGPEIKKDYVELPATPIDFGFQESLFLLQYEHPQASLLIIYPERIDRFFIRDQLGAIPVLSAYFAMLSINDNPFLHLHTGVYIRSERKEQDYSTISVSSLIKVYRLILKKL